VYLLDTKVLSEVLRKRPDAGLLARLGAVPAEALFTSCISVMELRHGAARRPDRGALWRRIEREVLPRVRVLGLDVEVALVAGEVQAQLWATGRPIDLEDVLIGATALVRRLAVVTNNVAHFARIPNLRVVNWMGR
jgi:predicted nucleic acid-binding protein